MKKILSYLSIVLLSASVACSDSSEMDKAYNSVITPGFTFGGEEIIAGITPVTFTNTTTAEGTTVSEYFWHFGFAGEGNWSEEAAPDPIVYNRPGDYTVTLTAWGADGNRATTTRTITVLADNVLPTADFSYSPQMISIGTTVTFTDNRPIPTAKSYRANGSSPTARPRRTSTRPTRSNKWACSTSS